MTNKEPLWTFDKEQPRWMSMLNNRAPHYLSFQGEPGHIIRINLDTGEVDFENITPSEGAKLFWECVELAYPGAIKKKVVGPFDDTN